MLSLVLVLVLVLVLFLVLPVVVGLNIWGVAGPGVEDKYLATSETSAELPTYKCTLIVDVIFQVKIKDEIESHLASLLNFLKHKKVTKTVLWW